VGIGTGFLPRPSVGLSFGLSVRWVNCGRADWICLPFGMVSGSAEGWVY